MFAFGRCDERQSCLRLSRPWHRQHDFAGLTWGFCCRRCRHRNLLAKSEGLLWAHQSSFRQQEPQGLAERADAVLALAFEHHLTIRRNFPLPLFFVDWLTDLAPRGVVEFVDKFDPTVQKFWHFGRIFFMPKTRLPSKLPCPNARGWLRHVASRPAGDACTG